MRIRYFAGAAEAAGCEEETFAGAAPLGELRARLAERHGAGFARVLARCSVLVDGTRLGDEDAVAEDATVDVLPPFAGG